MALKVTNPARGTVLAYHVRLADTFWSRLRGLLGRRALARGYGLLIKPTASVHTCFMLFPIDIAFLDEGGRVVKACHALPPFRVAIGGRGAKMALELPAGTLRDTGTQEGDRLLIEEAP
ncbi:MAG: DUF192 domain-containing protein [Dehalococcoidia bacterium]|jgi:uncharacterized membrane protein (UPF0127 family)|nr:DUF192 domain-containing protein [Dehalococcoidia bacterium]